jgi:muramoyltetrapeptide carboxypeptidase
MTPFAQSSDRRPPALRPGDLIAVPAPAGPVPPEVFEAGVRILETRYRVVHEEDILRREGYLAGGDARRAAELNAYLRDPAIRGIICARGGYGLMRILAELDDAAFRAAPKVLVGFSDVTALLYWVRARTGLRSVHGPVVTQLSSLGREDLAWLTGLLETGTPPPRLTGLRSVHGGRAQGPLVAGNLEVMSRLLGTPYFPSLRGAILVLEEIGERPYRIDRTLTQLALAGVLDELAGVVVGDLVRCEEPDGSGPGPEDVITERLERLAVPLCFGLPVGHGARNLALPIGAPALLDADAGALEFLEGAVE